MNLIRKTFLFNSIINYCAIDKNGKNINANTSQKELMMPETVKTHDQDRNDKIIRDLLMEINPFHCSQNFFYRIHI